MKKLFHLSLSVAFVMFMIPHSVFAAPEDELDGKILYTHTVFGPYNPEVDDTPPSGTFLNRMKPDGSQDEELEKLSFRITDVSPDGTKVLATQYNSTTGKPEIVVSKLDGSNRVVLTEGDGAKWSGDGKKIAFVRDSMTGGYHDIFVMDADGSNITQVTETPADESAVDINYDGSQLVFQSDETGRYHLYLMNADGTNKRQVTGDASNETAEYDPTYSPDGKMIAYGRYIYDEADVYTMDADGNNQINRTGNITDHVQHPVWSPDGKKLVLQQLPNTQDPNKMYTMNVDGTNLHVIENGKILNTPVGWIE
ncbi:TolB family protein [Polycladomyces subterraneus]|uniref:DUF5050 domain-containing protein n=1 Tax=Polycladomyces subterraneus TaxID=1016997 RepID=A0ABT8IN86_9BACL|nr:DUF5050 domain-containing protein [Polycladomyces subterraneus]MDN4594001.1 DUF5050 domain-containing protein [Polycladomyces subterraneus]